MGSYRIIIPTNTRGPCEAHMNIIGLSPLVLVAVLGVKTGTILKGLVR